MIRVKYFQLDWGENPGGKGQPKEITVDTDNVDEAFQAAVDDRGDWSRKMLYRFIEA